MDDFSKDVNRLARDAALEKVRKLLALARDGGATENEAETAARQAAAIMRKYQIDAAETLMREMDDDVAFSRELAAANPDARGGHRFEHVASWVGYVAVGVADLFDCVVDIVQTRDGAKVRYSGLESDAKVASWTHDYLCATIFRLSRTSEYRSSRSAATAFRVGAGSRVQARLFAMRAERDRQDAALRANGSSCTALTVIDRKRAIVGERFGAQRTQKARVRTHEHDAYDAGKRAGDGIQINRPIGGGGDAPRVGERRAISHHHEGG